MHEDRIKNSFPLSFIFCQNKHVELTQLSGALTSNKTLLGFFGFFGGGFYEHFTFLVRKNLPSLR